MCAVLPPGFLVKTALHSADTVIPSGPKRYDYVPEQDGWVYSRDGRSLSDLLNQELSDAFERKVELGLANVSSQVS